MLPNLEPFNPDQLDRLMDDGGIDVLFATSKHNVQYLLGGYRAQFFDFMDAIGVSRYLPLVLYPRGFPDKAAYFGHRFEIHQTAVQPLWIPEVRTKSWGCVDVIEAAVAYLKERGVPFRTIGVETPFLPFESGVALGGVIGADSIVDASFVLERLRARKSKREIDCMRNAADGVIDSMLSVIETKGGATKQELVDSLRREQTNRSLTFEYCLLTAGTSLNRSPSEQRWNEGDILSLDSGGNYQGYIGDLARMAILGEPDAELDDLLGEITAIQQAGLDAIRAGVVGAEVFSATSAVLAKSPNASIIDFMAHGVGLTTHEAPRLSDRAPVPYSAYDGDRPLEAEMIVSVETTMKHPHRGYIKLEDSALVREGGCEVFADRARGWNRGGASVGNR